MSSTFIEIKTTMMVNRRLAILHLLHCFFVSDGLNLNGVHATIFKSQRFVASVVRTVIRLGDQLRVCQNH